MYDFVFISGCIIALAFSIGTAITYLLDFFAFLELNKTVEDIVQVELVDIIDAEDFEVIDSRIEAYRAHGKKTFD